MENQPKKLRLEDITVESFVTSNMVNRSTIIGGDVTEHGLCTGNGLSVRCGTENSVANADACGGGSAMCVGGATNLRPGCNGPDEYTKHQVSCNCPSEYVTCPDSCYPSECPSPGPCR